MLAAGRSDEALISGRRISSCSDKARATPRPVVSASDGYAGPSSPRRNRQLADPL